MPIRIKTQPSEIREYTIKLFGKNAERLELDIDNSEINVMVWKIKRYNKERINKKIIKMKKEFKGCSIDQARISINIWDAIMTVRGFAAIIGMLIGLLAIFNDIQEHIMQLIKFL